MNTPPIENKVHRKRDVCTTVQVYLKLNNLHFCFPSTLPTPWYSLAPFQLGSIHTRWYFVHPPSLQQALIIETCYFATPLVPLSDSLMHHFPLGSIDARWYLVHSAATASVHSWCMLIWYILGTCLQNSFRPRNPCTFPACPQATLSHFFPGDYMTLMCHFRRPHAA